MAKEKDKVRLTLEFPSRVADVLDRLKEQSGSVTKAEVLRKALALMDLVLSCHAEGGKVVIQHKDGAQETIRLL